MKIPKTIRKLGNLLAGRGYAEIATPKGKAFAGWRVDSRSEDADVWMAGMALLPRVRDAFKSNPLYQKYREVLWAQTFGPEGLLLRMQIKETEDRVIHSAEEKAAIRAVERRWNRLAERAAKKTKRDFEPLCLVREFGSNGSRVAKIQIGEPDIFANQLIARKWKEWHAREFCDLRGTRNYHTIRQLRLIAAVRDGDIFIRLIRDPSRSINKFGFTLQLIPAEYCDRWLNCTLPNGNEVRMGIEYEWTAFGLSKAVAYYFLKRQQGDWQMDYNGMFGTRPTEQRHVRLPATDVVHYCRPVDPEGTRPAPWVCSSILAAHQLSEGTIAEVIAMRAEAMKLGFLYSDVLPEGGAPDVIDPSTDGPTAEEVSTPGAIIGLKYGVKYQESNPTHPSGNFMQFSQEVIRRIAAGCPGANYSEIANDYAAINFSAGRLQRLTSDSISYMIQTNDIDYGEIPIFSAWLEMALLTGEIPLPLSKFEKFNKPVFWGPRSPGVDPVKDINAAAFRIANNLSSWREEAADMGKEWRETILDKAENIAEMEDLGIEHSLTTSKPMPVLEAGAASEDETTQGANNQKPSKELAAERMNLE